MAKVRSKKRVKPEFQDIKAWCNNHLHPDVNDYDDPSVYEYVYHAGRWAGIFQCIDECSGIALADGNSKEIRNIRSGDVVVSYDQDRQVFVEKPVLNVFDQGEKDCVEVTFEDGRTLVCTADHLVFTQRGWIAVGKLLETDEVECFNVREHVNS